MGVPGVYTVVVFLLLPFLAGAHGGEGVLTSIRMTKIEWEDGVPGAKVTMENFGKQWYYLQHIKVCYGTSCLQMPKGFLAEGVDNEFSWDLIPRTDFDLLLILNDEKVDDGADHILDYVSVGPNGNKIPSVPDTIWASGTYVENYGQNLLFVGDTDGSSGGDQWIPIDKLAETIEDLQIVRLDLTVPSATLKNYGDLYINLEIVRLTAKNQESMDLIGYLAPGGTYEVEWARIGLSDKTPSIDLAVWHNIIYFNDFGKPANLLDFIQYGAAPIHATYGDNPPYWPNGEYFPASVLEVWVFSGNNRERGSKFWAKGGSTTTTTTTRTTATRTTRTTTTTTKTGTTLSIKSSTETNAKISSGQTGATVSEPKLPDERQERPDPPASSSMNPVVIVIVLIILVGILVLTIWVYKTRRQRRVGRYAALYSLPKTPDGEDAYHNMGSDEEGELLGTFAN